MDNVTGGSGDTVTINGRSRHVSSYLRDFLFPTERMNAPVSMLSGGERNRLLLARLFAKPTNLLVMDEPTNDLDVETLDLLEDMIADFPGTLLLVSHDREFLDNVVTSTLVFEADAHITEYAGGYTDWLNQKPQPQSPASRGRAREVPATPPAAPTTPVARKLSFKLQRELQSLPEQIQQLELSIAALQASMNAADFFRQPPAVVSSETSRLAALSAELEGRYARWQELEALAPVP